MSPSPVQKGYGGHNLRQIPVSLTGNFPSLKRHLPKAVPAVPFLNRGALANRNKQHKIYKCKSCGLAVY